MEKVYIPTTSLELNQSRHLEQTKEAIRSSVPTLLRGVLVATTGTLLFFLYMQDCSRESEMDTWAVGHIVFRHKCFTAPRSTFAGSADLSSRVVFSRYRSAISPFECGNNKRTTLVGGLELNLAMARIVPDPPLASLSNFSVRYSVYSHGPPLVQWLVSKMALTRLGHTDLAVTCRAVPKRVLACLCRLVSVTYINISTPMPNDRLKIFPFILLLHNSPHIDARNGCNFLMIWH